MQEDEITGTPDGGPFPMLEVLILRTTILRKIHVLGASCKHIQSIINTISLGRPLSAKHLLIKRSCSAILDVSLWCNLPYYMDQNRILCNIQCSGIGYTGDTKAVRRSLM